MAGTTVCALALFALLCCVLAPQPAAARRNAAARWAGGDTAFSLLPAAPPGAREELVHTQFFFDYDWLSPSPVASPSPPPSPSPVASPSPEASPSSVASPSPLALPSPVASPSPPPSPSPGASPSPEASPSPVASPSPLALPSPVASPSPLPLPSPVASPSPNASPSVEPHASPSPEASASPEAPPSPSPQDSPMLSLSPSPSPRASPSPSSSPSPLVHIFVSLFDGVITANATSQLTGTGSATGVFAGVPVRLSFAWTNGAPSLTDVTASNIDLQPAVALLFSGVTVPRVVTDVLALRLSALSARIVDQRTYITAGPTPEGTIVKAGLDGAGIRTVQVSLSGSLSFGSLITRLPNGPTFDVDVGDVLTISNPSVMYVRSNATVNGTLAPAFIDEYGKERRPGYFANISVSVPALDIQDAPMSISLTGGVATAEWTGNASPVQFVTLKRLSLSATRNVGMTGTASGMLVDIPVSVTVTLANKAAQDRGAARMTVTATARDVRASRTLVAIWSSTPPIIGRLLEPVAFPQLSVTYDDKSKRYTLSTRPNLGGVPSLKSVIEYLGSEDAIALVADSVSGLSLSVSRSVTVRPGSPFVGTATVTYGATVLERAGSPAIELGARFSGQINIDILQTPLVDVSVGAAATFSSVGAEARLDVSATGAMAIRGFSFIEIRSIAGSLTLDPKAVTITAANLRAQGRVIKTNVSVELAYDAVQRAFGFMAAIDEFGLQDTLKALGVNVNLGPADIKIRNAMVLFASKAVNANGRTFQAGLYTQGELQFHGLKGQVQFKLDNDGMDFRGRVDFSAILNAAYAEIEKVTKLIGVNAGDLRQVFFIDYVDLTLTLRKGKTVVKADLKMRMLGMNLEPRLDVNLNDSMFFAKAIGEEVKKIFTAACTKDQYDRGVGTVPTGCPSHAPEEFSALCYARCNQNWQYGAYGRDDICYQNCPPGYRDDDPVGKRGLTCSKVACDDGWTSDGALLCFQCRQGYSNLVGGVCYQPCPGGYKRVALNCERWGCNGNEDDNGAGLCYEKCRDGFRSDGAALCLGGCRHDYQTHPLTCHRPLHVYGKGCCCFFGRCCGRCNSPYVDTGCTCHRNPDTYSRETYSRKSRAKLHSFIPSSHVPPSRSAVKSWTRQRQSRGVGVPKSVCTGERPDNSAGLCYKRCRDGYGGTLTMCWARCPANYKDCGTFCVPSALSCGLFFGAIGQRCSSVRARESAAAFAALNVTNADNPGSPSAAAAVAAGAANGLPALVNVTGLEALVFGNSSLTADSPGCTTSLDCFCQGVRQGLRFANPFDSTRASFIACAFGAAQVVSCPAGTSYDKVSSNCLPPADGTAPLGAASMASASVASVGGAAADASFDAACAGVPDGLYARRNSSGAHVAYTCKGGVYAPSCTAGTSWDAAQQACTAAPIDAALAATTLSLSVGAPCTDASCFCKALPPGAYFNAFSAAMRGNTAVAARSPLPVRGRKVPVGDLLALYGSYLDCAPGLAAATVRSCAPGTVFVPSNGSCITLPAAVNTTSTLAGKPTDGPGAAAAAAATGANGTPVPGCTTVDCFCAGRPDGMYAQPNNASAGVVCGEGEPFAFSCPASFPYTDGYGCAQMGVAGPQSRRPHLPRRTAPGLAP